jgi:Uma2 family endonuclease
MSTAPVLPRSTWEQLVDAWRDLDVPEGWRAEIIEERIVMTPPPGYPHNLIASRVHKALVRVIPDDWAIFQTAGVSIPLRSNLFIPDLVVIPEDRVPGGEDPGPVLAAEALLAVEITSRSNADTDRKTKLWGYAHAGVPLYLLIDRFAEGAPSVELYSKPNNGVYQESHRVPFGKPITLPEPFDLTLETGEF